MIVRSETPRYPGSLPASERPTSALLKADNDGGATGDTMKATDPGLSLLGTDDEAAWHAPSHARIAPACETEAAHARMRSAVRPHGPQARVVPGSCAVIGRSGFGLGGSLWLV